MAIVASYLPRAGHLARTDDHAIARQTSNVRWRQGGLAKVATIGQLEYREQAQCQIDGSHLRTGETARGARLRAGRAALSGRK